LRDILWPIYWRGWIERTASEIGGENFGLCKQYAFYIHGPDARIACSQRTRVTGAFPAEWSAMRKLRVINLSACRMQGPLPTAIWPELRQFSVYMGALTGDIPQRWCGMKKIRILELS
jgi:hypothetical protein